MWSIILISCLSLKQFVRLFFLRLLWLDSHDADKIRSALFFKLYSETNLAVPSFYMEVPHSTGVCKENNHFYCRGRLCDLLQTAASRLQKKKQHARVDLHNWIVPTY